MVFAAPNDALARAEEVLDADPSPLHASVAHQVIGIWQRDWGDMRIALNHLRRARDLAARAEAIEREVRTGAVLLGVHASRETLPAIRAALEGSGAGRVLTANWDE